jgi:hypothetical protein
LPVDTPKLLLGFVVAGCIDFFGWRGSLEAGVDRGSDYRSLIKQRGSPEIWWKAEDFWNYGSERQRGSGKLLVMSRIDEKREQEMGLRLW